MTAVGLASIPVGAGLLVFGILQMSFVIAVVGLMLVMAGYTVAEPGRLY